MLFKEFKIVIHTCSFDFFQIGVGLTPFAHQRREFPIFLALVALPKKAMW